uniref:Uncharacterized protein n=1 Tax=viral metagenome TaxID=1070528 RepID=A0A6C0IKE2_9ZZZZ
MNLYLKKNELNKKICDVMYIFIYVKNAFKKNKKIK